MRGLDVTKKVLVYASLSIGVGLFLIPFGWLVLVSFFTKPGQQVIKELSPTIASYTYLFTKGNFGHFFLNSSIVAVSSTFIVVMIGSLAAYSISRFRFKGRNFYLALLLVLQMFAAVLLVIPLFLLLRSLHITNTLAALIVSHTAWALPFCTLLLKGYFDTIPNELEEAARIDGCSRLGSLVKIVAPLSGPGVAVAALFAFFWSWGEFILALTLVQDQSLWTLPIQISKSITPFEIFWGKLSAGAVVFVIPVVIMYAFLQRFIIQGLTAGGVKGE